MPPGRAINVAIGTAAQFELLLRQMDVGALLELWASRRGAEYDPMAVRAQPPPCC